MAVAELSVGQQFDIGRVATRTFDVVRNNFVVFFGLGLIASVPASLYRIVIATITASAAQAGTNRVDPHTLSYYMLGAAASGLVGAFLSLVLQAALTYGTISYLNGHPVRFGRAFGVGLRQFFPLLAIGFLEALGIGAGFLLLIVPGVMLFVMWSVVVPVRVAEEAGITASFGRSRALTAGYRWPIFGTLAIYFIGAGIAQAMTNPVVTAGALSSSSAAAGYVTIVLTFIVTAIVSVVSATLVSSIYYELRLIKEGVGPETIASVFD